MTCSCVPSLCWVVWGITFFLASSWGPPVWANFKIHTSTGFCSTSNLAPLPCFLQDLGMESTSLDDVLYRYASFRNLVDPITHDLIISLARYIHCPKPVGTLVSSLLYNGAGLGNRSAGSLDLPSEFQGKNRVTAVLVCLWTGRTCLEMVV